MFFRALAVMEEAERDDIELEWYKRVDFWHVTTSLQFCMLSFFYI